MDKFHILNFSRADDGFAAIVTSSNKRQLTFNHTFLYFTTHSEDRLWQGIFEAKNWNSPHTRGLKSIVNFRGVGKKRRPSRAALLQVIRMVIQTL
mgnify:CR=1 FL=1